MIPPQEKTPTEVDGMDRINQCMKGNSTHAYGAQRERERERGRERERERERADSIWVETSIISRNRQRREKCEKIAFTCNNPRVALCLSFHAPVYKFTSSLPIRVSQVTTFQFPTHITLLEILKDIYTDISVTVHLHKESEKIRIKRGVGQWDTTSPKLFTATLESIFRRLNWENKGVRISLQSSLCWWHIPMHRNTTRTTTDATRTIRWK